MANRDNPLEQSSHPNGPEATGELEAACQEALEMLEGIQEGKRILEAMDPESYLWCEWIGDIKFCDQTGILADVRWACNLADDCFVQKRYDLVLTLGYQLLELQVRTDDGSGCVEEIEFEELRYVDIDYLDMGEDVEIPISTLVMDMMQAEYFTGEHPQEAIRKLMDLQNYPKLKLQDLLDAMEKEPENFPQFLQGWLALNTMKPDAYSVTLAQEAILMLPDLASQLKCVQDCAKVNPQLYLTVVRNQALSLEERYQAATDGVQTIAVRYRVRSDVALEAAALAAVLNLPRQDIETHWREAFRSDTSPMNYLRLLLHAADSAAASSWMDTILKRPLPEWSSSLGRLAKTETNYTNAFRTFLFRILKGDFQSMLQKSIWDTTAVPPEMCIIFTILFQGEPKSLLMKQEEKDAIAALSFDPKVYQMGLPKGEQKKPNEQVFRECLRQWKGMIAYPSPEECLKFLDQLDGAIEENVAATMIPCNRKDYPQKAALVAALGEVRESLGEANGLQKMLNRYAETWHTHRSFTRELHSFDKKG